MRPVVVVLNGVGSVGKSSTARALQAIVRRPLLHLAMDTFIAAMPERLLGDADGLMFERLSAAEVAVRSGPVLARALRGMRHAVAAMAGQGNDLVVDEVLIGAEGQREYRALLTGAEVRFVGLFAPLEVLETRERARGDREIGLARWQFGRVHEGVEYDLRVDTGGVSPGVAARVIRDAFDL